MLEHQLLLHEQVWLRGVSQVRHGVLPGMALGSCSLLQSRWVHLEHRVVGEPHSCLLLVGLVLLLRDFTTVEFLPPTLELHLVLLEQVLDALRRHAGLTTGRLSWCLLTAAWVLGR